MLMLMVTPNFTKKMAVTINRVMAERSVDRSSVSPVVSQLCQSTVGSTMASMRCQRSSNLVASVALEPFVDALTIIFNFL